MNRPFVVSWLILMLIGYSENYGWTVSIKRLELPKRMLVEPEVMKTSESRTMKGTDMRTIEASSEVYAQRTFILGHAVWTLLLLLVVSNILTIFYARLNLHEEWSQARHVILTIRTWSAQHILVWLDFPYSSIYTLFCVSCTSRATLKFKNQSSVLHLLIHLPPNPASAELWSARHATFNIFLSSTTTTHQSRTAAR